MMLEYCKQKPGVSSPVCVRFILCNYVIGAGGSSAGMKEPSTEQNTEVIQPVAAAPAGNNTSNFY